MKGLQYLIIYSLLIYFYLHNPSMKITGGLGTIKLLYPLCFLYFIAYSSQCIRFFSLFKKELLVLILLILFCFLRAIIGGDMTIAYTHLIMVIESFFIPLIFTAFFIRNKVNFDTVVRIILLTSAIAATISVLCLAIPSFGQYVRYSLLTIKQNDYLFDADYRGFGISDALTSSYGYIQGFCFALGIHYFKKNKWYFFFLPFVFLSTIINARTGVLVSLIGVVLHLISSRQKIQKSYSLIILSIALLLIVPPILSMINISSDTMSFIDVFISDIINIVTTQDLRGADTTTHMIDSMVFWPNDTFEWIIGKGGSVFGGDKNMNSDIGYIIHLNYGGLVYVTLWLYFFITVIKKMVRCKVDRFLIFSFVFVSLFLNIKSSFFSNVGVFRLFMLLHYVSFVYCLNSNITNKINGINLHLSRCN